VKRVIITRADKHVKWCSDISHPIFKKYAKKCNADFVVLSHKAPFLTDDNLPHYRILKIRELLDKYDRVLHLDTDMIINKGCPNLFDVVPKNMVGSIYEDKGSRASHRRSLIGKIQRAWGDVGWREGYTNAGTFMLSKEHKDIFLPHNNKYWLGWGSADVHMSYMIHKLGFKVKELSFKWNHMTMFSEKWNNNANRFNSFIIHYGGRGIFDNGVQSRIEQMKLDLGKIYK